MNPNIKILILLVLALANQMALADNTPEPTQGKECFSVKYIFEGRGSHCHPEFGYSCVYYNKIPKLDISSLADVASGKAFEDYIDEHKKYLLCDTLTKNDTIRFFYLDPTIDVSKICVKTYVNGMENDSYQEFYFSTNKIGETPITKSGSDPCNNNWNEFRGGYSNSYDVTTILTYDVPIDIIGINKREIYIDEGETLILKLGEFFQNDDEDRKIQFKIDTVTGKDNWLDLKAVDCNEIRSNGISK